MARPTPQQLKSHPARHASSTIANSMPDYDGADISVEPAAFGDTAPRSAGATASAEDIPRGVGARPLAGGGLGEALGAVMGGDEQLLAQIARLKSEQAALRENKKKENLTGTADADTESKSLHCFIKFSLGSRLVSSMFMLLTDPVVGS